MTTKLREAGKAISAANQEKIRVAIKTLSDLLDRISGDPDDSVAAKEAATAATPIQTRAEIRAQLQSLIDYIGNPDTIEQLEGDGDGDNDPDNVVLQGALGDGLVTTDAVEAKKSTVTGLTCASCGAQVKDPWANYCTSCGKSLRGKPKAGYCSNCGQVLSADDDFCAGCGTGVTKEAGNLLEKARNFSKEERDKMAKSGEAMDDGSYPIPDKDALRRAKMAFGRNPAPEVKAHINKRARALGEPEMDEDDKKDTKESRSLLSRVFGSATEDIELRENFIPLKEKAVGRDGLINIKLISPGWGSSGYYPQETLRRDGTHLFEKGTKMFWNHPTVQEERDRPERDLRDLAAVTESDAIYLEEGAEGPGLYALARPVGAYKDAIEELAPHIGVSINAQGQGKKGKAEGKVGPIIERIIARKSVDFVTEPGAGGKILQLFEAARGIAHPELDLTESGTTVKENTEVSDLDLKEANRRLQEAKDENARLRERLALRDARELADDVLRSVEGLPAPTVKRLTESLARDPVLDDDGDLDKPAFRAKIKEAVKDELSYIESLGRTGKPRGMGSSRDLRESDGDDDFDGDKFESSLKESFGRLGLDENVIKHAAAGR